MSHRHHNEKQQDNELAEGSADIPLEEAGAKPDEQQPEEANAESRKESGAQQTEEAETIEGKNPTEAGEIESLRKELAETQKKLLYLQADYQNYRKRISKEIAEARIYGAAGALEPFITVYDYLNMARQAAEQSDTIEQIRQGLSMILDQYQKAFEESGVSRVETVGKPFDPSVHEAVAREASDEIPEGIVLKEWSGGYRFGERLLRPAKVIVSSGGADEKEA